MMNPFRNPQLCVPLCERSAKIPGRQKIHVSHNWGFTRFTKEEYQKYQGEGRLIPKGNHVRRAYSSWEVAG